PSLATESSDSEEDHNVLIGSVPARLQHAKLIQRYYSELAQLQADQYHAEALVTILEATSEALQGLIGVASGGAGGGVGSIFKLGGTFAELNGYQKTARILNLSGDSIEVYQGVKDVYNVARSLKVLVPAVQDTGIIFRNVGEIPVGSVAGELYKDLIQPS